MSLAANIRGALGEDIKIETDEPMREDGRGLGIPWDFFISFVISYVKFCEIEFCSQWAMALSRCLLTVDPYEFSTAVLIVEPEAQ